ATAPLRASTAQATIPPRTAAGAARARAGGSASRGTGGRSRRTLIGALAAAAVMAVAAVGLAVVLIGGGEEQPSPAPRPNTVAPPPAASTPAGGNGGGSAGSARVDRGQVTVAVLNGTTFTGLARSASDKLTRAGFRPGVVTNDTTNQARSATAIFYSEGQRRAALDVARLIGIGRDAVQPLDRNTSTIAGDADVVVSVGADQAR
ncbi:MAG TPA: LytR C-terminal domain-containing protein, partial [Solirubrobacteraceae bacterium]|nr:LytR C-terminal domain-containing protein [Solirubrobacteraceae bacterium]